MRTRSSLVAPLLRALGWDGEDPAQVLVDCRDPEQEGVSGYTFLCNSMVIGVIEANKYGERLSYVK